MATTSNMFMYSLTLKPSTAITQAVAGHFTGTRAQQVLTASGSRLTLYEVFQKGKYNELLSHDVFGIIRQVAVFRIGGSTLDHIVISSDSGRVTVLEYNQSANEFVRPHLETFGKSGIRRVIPGEFMGVDAKGRAVMLASVEKNKIVYIINRNQNTDILISSPLEAVRPSSLTFALIGLDAGWDNPIFASLEVDVGDSDQDPTDDSYNKIEKQLVYYELDLGLNHVVRKWSDVVERSANMLIAVPGGDEGPSGVIVCSEEVVTYHHNNQGPTRVVIPRRRHSTEDPDRKRLIISSTMFKMPNKQSDFFFLLQTDDGDLFRLTIQLVHTRDGTATGEVDAISLEYYGTIPRATSLIVLRVGVLFAVSESGDHQMYEFQQLTRADAPKVSSKDYPVGEPYEPAFFDLEELVFYPEAGVSDESKLTLEFQNSIPSLHPQIKMRVANVMREDSPQIYSICGSGARSFLKIARHGVPAAERVNTVLPSTPTAIYSVKKRADDQYDSYIVLSFSNGSLTLGISDAVEEVNDTGLLTSAATLAVQQVGEDSIVQVHPRGLRQVFAGGHIIDWPAPQHRSIVSAATNNRQVAVGLSSGEIVYFELDDDGTLAEFEDRPEMSGTITAMNIGEIPEGRQRSDYLAIGCDDSTVRIFSLSPDSALESKSTQALSYPPSSLRIMSMQDTTTGGQQTFLHIGLTSGVYIRTVMDPDNGTLSDTRSRFLGANPVQLFKISHDGRDALAAISSRPWLIYNDTANMNIAVVPLLYYNLEQLHSISAAICGNELIGYEGNTLTIFGIPRFTSPLMTDSIALKNTPKGFVQHPTKPYFFVIEADCNVLSESTRAQLQHSNGTSIANDDSQKLDARLFGYPKGGDHWASCIQIVDVSEGKFEKQQLRKKIKALEDRKQHNNRAERDIAKLQEELKDLDVNPKPAVKFTLDLDNNEAAVAVGAISFASQDGETYLIVATGKDMVPSKGKHSGGFLHTYAIDEDSRSITLLHKTSTEVPCYALHPFQGKLLAGIGRSLRLFDIGQKQLLRKAQGQVVTNTIVGIATMGPRVVVSDVRESVTYCVYRAGDNAFYPFVDDSITRWVTTHTLVDYETVAGGDKFGNFWLMRCPEKASEAADTEGSGIHLAIERFAGAEYRVDSVAHFYVQDVPTSLCKTTLVPGGRDILIWGGIQGTIGVMIPFQSREDVDFFVTLETQIKTVDSPLAGRDHLAYRGYYVPPKGVIDGDLCERFYKLPREKKARIAAELNRDIREVERKIGEARSRYAF